MESSLPDKLLAEFRQHPKILLKKSWGEFIARWPWEWFVTLTFTDDTHEERAIKLFRVWKNRLNKQLFGPRWHKRLPFGVCWVLAVEYQKSGRVHLHILIAGVGQTRRLDWMDNWWVLDHLAGYARIYPVKNQHAVSNYVTKYVTKDGNIHLSDNLKNISADLFYCAVVPTEEQASEWIAPDVGSCNER